MFEPSLAEKQVMEDLTPKLLNTIVTLSPLKVSLVILNSSLSNISVALFDDKKSLILLKIILACASVGANTPIIIPFLNGCKRVSSANNGILANTGSITIKPDNVADTVKLLPLCRDIREVIVSGSFKSTPSIILLLNCA